jgi:CRISPR-associated protein Csy2
VTWEIRRKPGWLVPLPIGYAGISPLYAPGEVANSRDDSTPFRFVESLYSLGQWISPHRLDTIEQLLWTQESDPEAGLYRCRNRYAESLAASPVEILNPTPTQSKTSSQEQHHG